MKKIYDSVALGIVAVYELKDLIADERNDEKKGVLESIRYTYYYLIKNLNEQFGVTRINVVDALIENGYPRDAAIMILDSYEEWACHVVKINKHDENI